MSDIKIMKVKLLKGGEKVEIQFKETGDLKSSVDKVCDQHAHVDFTNAMNSLSCHLAILTDYLTEKRAMDKEELAKFVVTAYSIGGNEEDGEGVTITGYRKTKSGKTVTLNTPFLKLDSSSESYYLIGNLNDCIKKIENEVLLYLDGKKAPDEQQKLDFPEGEGKVTNMKIDHPASEYEGDAAGYEKLIEEGNKRKNGKKKVAQSASVPSGELSE